MLSAFLREIYGGLRSGLLAHDLALHQHIASPSIRTHPEGRTRSPDPVSLTMEAILRKTIVGAFRSVRSVSGAISGSYMKASSLPRVPGGGRGPILPEDKCAWSHRTRNCVTLATNAACDQP